MSEWVSVKDLYNILIRTADLKCSAKCARQTGTSVRNEYILEFCDDLSKFVQQKIESKDKHDQT